jgi:hypothetical protein
MAYFALHNFIHDSNLRDKEFERCDADEQYLVPSISGTAQMQEDGSEEVENEDTMNTIHDKIVREEDSYVDIYHNFMSYLPCVIATVLFMRTIWMKNLENLIFFFPNYTFKCEIVNILCLYEYFGLYTVPQTFRGITGISPTAYSFPQLTAAIPKHSSTFPTAAFLH